VPQTLQAWPAAGGREIRAEPPFPNPARPPPSDAYFCPTPNILHLSCTCIYKKKKDCIAHPRRLCASNQRLHSPSPAPHPVPPPGSRQGETRSSLPAKAAASLEVRTWTPPTKDRPRRKGAGFLEPQQNQEEGLTPYRGTCSPPMQARDCPIAAPGVPHRRVGPHLLRPTGNDVGPCHVLYRPSVSCAEPPQPPIGMHGAFG